MLQGLAVFVLALVGSFLLVQRFRRAPPDKRALADRVTATRPFADAAIGDEAKIEGVVTLIDKLCVEGPVIEEPGVWIEAELLEDPDPDTTSITAARVRAVVPFSIDGVRVQPGNERMAWPLISLVRQRSSSPVETPTERMHAFFGAHGADLDVPRARSVKSLVCVERCLMPGTSLLVLGKKVRGTTLAEPTGYREVREPPAELAASSFYESERVIAREGDLVPWSTMHTFALIGSFVALGAVLGAVVLTF